MFPHPITVEKLQPSQAERDALEPHGIVRIPLKTGLNIGPVNVTLVMGNPHALIDTAMHHANNLERLEASLHRYHIKLEEIGEIWLTHPHIDHFGLTGAIVKRSGARVYAPESSVHRFDQYVESWYTDRDAFYTLLQESGVTAPILEYVRSSESSFHTVASPFTVDDSLKQGTSYTIAGRHSLLPIHAPGHTPWCSAFWMPETGVMVCGDVLRQKMRFNLILYPDPNVDQEHQTYPSYRKTLQKLSDTPVKWMIPGHGVSFQNHQKTIRLAMRRQEKRKELVLAHLQENGPSTAYEVAVAMYTSSITERALLLIMSDTVALLRWLIEDGAAESTVQHGVRSYSPTSQPLCSPQGDPFKPIG